MWWVSLISSTNKVKADLAWKSWWDQNSRRCDSRLSFYVFFICFWLLLQPVLITANTTTSVAERMTVSLYKVGYISCTAALALEHWICCILIRGIILKPHLRQTVLKYSPKNATFPKETGESLCVCLYVCVLFSAFHWKSRNLLSTPAKMVMSLRDFLVLMRFVPSKQAGEKRQFK